MVLLFAQNNASRMGVDSPSDGRMDAPVNILGFIPDVSVRLIAIIPRYCSQIL